MALEIVDFPIENGDFPIAMFDITRGYTNGLSKVLQWYSPRTTSLSSGRTEDPASPQIAGFQNVWFVWFDFALDTVIQYVHVSSCIYLYSDIVYANPLLESWSEKVSYQYPQCAPPVHGMTLTARTKRGGRPRSKKSQSLWPVCNTSAFNENQRDK